MTGKYRNAGQLQQYMLVGTGICGDWGCLQADLNEDCVVSLTDVAKMGLKWMQCSDPSDPICDEFWQ